MRADPDDKVSKGELSREEKRRRVVLKKVNFDRQGPRQDFLKRGTIAQGAAESGQVEAYMNAKLWRNPFARGTAAGFKGRFVCTEQYGGFDRGSQWLVWDYESDATLGAALEGEVGRFPEDLAEYVTGREVQGGSVAKREVTIIRTIFRKARRPRVSRRWC